MNFPSKVPKPKNSWFRSPTGLVLLGFLAIAAFFLITEHTAHLFGVLPFVLLLLCPLMHLFMHGGHGSHGGHSQPGSNSDNTKLPQNHNQHMSRHHEEETTPRS